jgi:hypothetical protein
MLKIPLMPWKPAAGWSIDGKDGKYKRRLVATWKIFAKYGSDLAALQNCYSGNSVKSDKSSPFAGQFAKKSSLQHPNDVRPHLSQPHRQRNVRYCMEGMIRLLNSCLIRLLSRLMAKNYHTPWNLSISEPIIGKLTIWTGFRSIHPSWNIMGGFGINPGR